MAKVYFGSLLTGISGRLGTNVYSIHTGVPYMKLFSTPNNPQTSRQQLVRARWATLTGNWAALTEMQQKMWDKYGSLLGKHHGGFAAFMKLNQRLLAADHVDLVQIDHPPSIVSTPDYMTGWAVGMSGSAYVKMEWTAPLKTDLYVTTYYKLAWNYGGGYNPYDQFVETVRSDVGEIVFAHGYDAGVTMWFKAVTMDTYGRQSPKTHRIRVVTT